MVTSAQANTILNEPKMIGANLVWKVQRGSYRLEATVLATISGEILSLRGTVGPKNRSFALLWKNTPIRKYTVHERHRDPVTKQSITGPHKHTWDDLWEDQRAYVPKDIRIGDPNEELMDFLAECAITLRGTYQRQTFFLNKSGGA